MLASGREGRRILLWLFLCLRVPRAGFSFWTERVFLVCPVVQSGRYNVAQGAVLNNAARKLSPWNACRSRHKLYTKLKKKKGGNGAAFPLFCQKLVRVCVISRSLPLIIVEFPLFRTVGGVEGYFKMGSFENSWKTICWASLLLRVPTVWGGGIDKESTSSSSLRRNWERAWLWGGGNIPKGNTLAVKNEGDIRPNRMEGRRRTKYCR